MTEQYQKEVKKIKRKLSKYTDDSFLHNMFKHFQEILNSDIGVINNFPWCCFLAMKWKFSDSAKNSIENMPFKDFKNIIDKIYSFQSIAQDIDNNDKIYLNIRRMMIHQFLYQSSLKNNLYSLVRQYIWYCLYDKTYYKKAFKEFTGFELENYYKITFFILVGEFQNLKGISSFKIKLEKLIIQLIPFCGVQQVKKYLDLVCIKKDKIRAMISSKEEVCSTMEYYEETPFIDKPFILDNDQLIVLCHKLTEASFINLVPELFKKHLNSRYKSHFGSTMEQYISEQLDKYEYSYLSERKMKEIYKENNKLDSKVVDFFIEQDDGYVFIDSKAIEPSHYIKSSNNPDILKQRLNTSFIKGIFQGEECAQTLDTLKVTESDKKKTLIIVVHRDHYIPNAKTSQQLFYPNLLDDITKNISSIPIPIALERIYYLTIDEFEYLLSFCKQENLSINEVITYCETNDANPKTQKANFTLHLQHYSSNSFHINSLIIDASEDFFNSAKELLEKQKNYWKSDSLNNIERYLSYYNYLLNDN